MRYPLALLTLPLMAGTVHVYVANSAGDDVTEIDTATNRVVQTIKVSNNPHGIVPSPDKSRFWPSAVRRTTCWTWWIGRRPR